MTFHVGQKIVCVDDKEDTFVLPGVKYSDDFAWGIERGEVYVVHNLYVDWFDGVECVNLVGVRRQFGNFLGFEPGFAAARFRPLQEKGMSILRSIAVNPKRELEGV